MAQRASAINTGPEIYNYAPSISGCTAVDRLASSQIQVGTFFTITYFITLYVYISYNMYLRIKILKIKNCLVIYVCFFVI